MTVQGANGIYFEYRDSTGAYFSGAGGVERQRSDVDQAHPRRQRFQRVLQHGWSDLDANRLTVTIDMNDNYLAGLAVTLREPERAFAPPSSAM